MRTVTRRDVDNIRNRWTGATFYNALDAVDFTMMNSDAEREIALLMRGPGDVAVLLAYIDALPVAREAPLG